MKYTVWSKSKSTNWVIERSFGAEIYAQQLAEAINNNSDRITKIVER